MHMTPEEAAAWKPEQICRALSRDVLAVAQTRIEGAWAAYVAAVPGKNHRLEMATVLENGTKLDRRIAAILFPIFSDIPYAS